MDDSGNASSGSKASPKRRATTPRGVSTVARPKRSPVRNARAQLSLEQLLEKLEELEKYKTEEEKGRKKEEGQRKKDLLAAKKRLTREITTTKGVVRKRNMEVGKLKQQLHKLEARQDDSMKKKTQTAARLDETIHKSEQKHNQTEVELAQKIGEMGEARGTLAYLEYAQEMLEKGVMLPRNQQAELQAAQMGRLRAIASHESAVAENLDSPEAAKALATDLDQMRKQFEFAEEQRLVLEQQSGESRAEWQEELQILRGEVGQLRDENLALRQRLDAASGTVKAQDERIETLRTRLQNATTTMKEKVERIEELTETVTVQAEPMSSSSEGLLDGLAMERSRPVTTDVSLTRAADEAGGFIGHTPSKQDHSFAGSHFMVATELPPATETNGTVAVGDIFHDLPETSETHDLSSSSVPVLVSRASAASGVGTEVPVLVSRASAASGVGTESAPNFATGPMPDTPPIVGSVQWQSNGGQGPLLASARHGGSHSGSLRSCGPSGTTLQDELFDKLDSDRDGCVSRVDFKKAVKSGLLAQGHATARTPPRQRIDGFASAADAYAALNGGSQAGCFSTTPQKVVHQALPAWPPNTANVSPLARDGFDNKHLASTPRGTGFSSPPAAILAAPWLANPLVSSRSSSTLRQGRSATRIARPLVSPPAPEQLGIPAFVNASAPNANVASSSNFRSPSATPPLLSPTSIQTSASGKLAMPSVSFGDLRPAVSREQTLGRTTGSPPVALGSTYSASSQRTLQSDPSLSSPAYAAYTAIALAQQARMKEQAVGSTAEAAYAALASSQAHLTSGALASLANASGTHQVERLYSGRLTPAPFVTTTSNFIPVGAGGVVQRARSPSPPRTIPPQRSAASTFVMAAPTARSVGFSATATATPRKSETEGVMVQAAANVAQPPAVSGSTIHERAPATSALGGPVELVADGPRFVEIKAAQTHADVHGGLRFKDAVHKVTAKALREYKANHRNSLSLE